MPDVFGLEESARALVDSRPEVRQRAALRIAQCAAAVFRELPTESAHQAVSAEVAKLASIYLDAVQPAYRRAGMVALRGLLHGLPPHSFPEPLVHQCTTLVTRYMADADPAVRVAAAEATHELVRKFRSQAVQLCFRLLFAAMTCAVSDMDPRVAALGREVSLAAREVMSGDSSLQLDPTVFALFLCDTLEPFACQTAPSSLQRGPQRPGSTEVVSWVLEWTLFALDSPCLRLVRRLAVMLPTLLRVAAAQAPGEEPSAPGSASSQDVARVLLACRDSLDAAIVHGSRDLAMDEIVDCLVENAAGPRPSDAAHRYPMPTPVRRSCLEWLSGLISATKSPPGECGAALVGASDAILRCALPYLSSPSAALERAADAICSDLMHLLSVVWSDPARCGAPDGGQDEMTARAVATLCSFLPPGLGASDGSAAPLGEQTAVGVLRWFAFLLKTAPAPIRRDRKGCVRASVAALLCASPAPVSGAAAELLFLLVEAEHGEVQSVVDCVFEQLRANSCLVLPALPTILKLLQAHLGTACCAAGDARLGAAHGDTRLLVAIARSVAAMGATDPRLASKCVVAANAAMLTADEFSRVRAALRSQPNEAEEGPFAQICGGWQYSAVSLFSMCLLSGKYAVAFEVCAALGETESSPATLVQLDRVAQLIDSPIFSHLRLQLMRPSRCPSLVRALFGLLMLLPQVSPQYELLHRRLSLLPSLAQLEAHHEDADGAPSGHASLLEEFAACQCRLLEAEISAARDIAKQ